MREILFRGKRLDNGEWLTGDLRHWRNGKIGIHDEATKNTIPIDPATVGQYTGLKDKNGKRIFEGDIIKRFWLGAEIIYCVKYEEENAQFIGEALNKRGFTTFSHDGEMFEVIGNIHDNPELLEGGVE